MNVFQQMDAVEAALNKAGLHEAAKEFKADAMECWRCKAVRKLAERHVIIEKAR